MDKLRIVFLGTPESAVPTLKLLIAHSAMEVVAVVSQPDRPVGRNHKLHLPPTKVIATAYNIPVLQPESLARSPETVEALRALAPDLIVMVAFGQILKQAVLSLPRMGVVNLHFSLLPAYRGAAPVNWAIINGDTISGITTMFTEKGIDTGPILLQQSMAIDPNVDAQELIRHMSQTGATLTIQTIEKLVAGTLAPQKQDASKATYAPILTKNLGLIDWSQSAQKIHNLVRGLIPWPGAFTFFRGEPLKIWQTSTEISAEARSDLERFVNAPGALFACNKNLMVKCGPHGREALRLTTVQPVNRSRLAAYDWINGARISSGELLGQKEAR